jgi:transcriptional regulator with XRE-family HTH domain
MQGRTSQDVDPVFSLRLREAIAAKGMSQEAVARATGVTLRTVQFWCAGDREPKGRQLVALSEVLGRDAGWFFELEEAA